MSSRRFKLSRPTLAALAVLMLLSAHVFGSTYVSKLIDAQPLVLALERFAADTGLQLVYRSSLGSGLLSPGAAPGLNERDTLEQLLRGTGLQFELVNNKTLTIQKIPETVPSSDLVSQSADQVVITGDALEALAPIGASVVTITRRDILHSGLSTVQDIVRTLPQSFNGGATDGMPIGVDPSFNRSRAVGLDLRGIGPGSTLVLINGRRIAPTAGEGHFVDVSTIPLSAIERIELVMEGSSAIYGADAIGGIINLVLRENFVGAETQAKLGTVTQGATQETQAAQVFGADWATGASMLSVDYYKRDNLQTDRDGGWDLLAGNRRWSAVGTLRQEVDDSTQLFAEMLVAERHAGFRNPSAFEADLASVQNKAVVSTSNFTLGAAHSCGATCTVTAFTSYSGGTERVRDLETRDVNLWNVNVSAQGTLLRVNERDLRITAGADVREQTLDSRAAFVELAVPVTSTALLSLAGRHEHYTDYGSTTIPSLGGEWFVLPALKVRASWARSWIGGRTWTWSLATQSPALGLAASLNYFNLDLETRRLPTLQPSAVATSGFDLLMSRATQTVLGAIDLRLAATYLREFRRAEIQDRPFINLLDTAHYPINLRVRSTASWDFRDVGASASLSYFDDYTDNTRWPQRRVGSWTTFDLQLRTGSLDGSSLALNVENVFDRGAPFLDYDAENAYLLGRFVSVQLRRHW